jgi:hypothetical protein
MYSSVTFSRIVGCVLSSGVRCCIVWFWSYSRIILLLVSSFYVRFLVFPNMTPWLSFFLRSCCVLLVVWTFVFGPWLQTWKSKRLLSIHTRTRTLTHTHTHTHAMLGGPRWSVCLAEGMQLYIVGSHWSNPICVGHFTTLFQYQEYTVSDVTMIGEWWIGNMWAGTNRRLIDMSNGGKPRNSSVTVARAPYEIQKEHLPNTS